MSVDPSAAATFSAATQDVVNGNLAMAILVSLLGGLVSFFSPCILPLVPAYVGYVAGSHQTSPKRVDSVAGVSLFILGFSSVFISTGAAFGYVGNEVLAYQGVISRLMGFFVIVAGVFYAELLPIRQREYRIALSPRLGFVGAPLLGLTFGLGWIPCTGPVLAAVNSLALNEGSAGRGAVLSAAYCAGIGFPFMVASVAFQGAIKFFKKTQKHSRQIKRFGGALLVVTGILLIFGLWQNAASWFQNGAANL
ncbi:cytochrome c biogenesis CcdA family protein [Streptomyces sp. NPDC088923]|uniref:cytochrome c biogenesis CcdA family protein n=1 Tax=Streptomyces sp. NPDC088923 TaxID=3365913 RepID=UPI0037F510EB